MKNTRRYFLSAMPAVALATLVGCNESGVPTTADGDSATVKAPAAGRPTLAEIKTQAKGFVMGNAMAAAQVFVFFDAQCPHCSMLWNEVQPLQATMQFTWIPVGLMNPKSSKQGAAILGSADPIKAMSEHKASMLAQQGGISMDTVNEVNLKAIETNTALFNRLGASGIPYIIGRHATTGEEVVVPGGMPAAGLAAKFGAPMPSAPPKE